MDLTVLTWNLFHGRDFPPDPSLFTWRSRLLGTTERSATHVQVNRDLFGEFASVLAGTGWDLALLQECPPRWSDALAAACTASPHRSLTSRNLLSPLRCAIARRNPDLLGSWEGGSNLTLVREGAVGGSIVERREATLRHLPERRTMAFTRLAAGFCVANLHASAPPRLAAEDVLDAAALAVAWSGDQPLLFGGDLNLRPAESDVFAELERRHDLRGPAATDSIDHLLARGLDFADPSRPWPPERREVDEQGGALRLSDHAPVQARLASPASEPR